MSRIFDHFRGMMKEYMLLAGRDSLDAMNVLDTCRHAVRSVPAFAEFDDFADETFDARCIECGHVRQITGAQAADGIAKTAAQRREGEV